MNIHEAKHRAQKCDNCGGKGYIITEGQKVTCGVCNGKGRY